VAALTLAMSCSSSASQNCGRKKKKKNSGLFVDALNKREEKSHALTSLLQCAHHIVSIRPSKAVFCKVHKQQSP